MRTLIAVTIALWLATLRAPGAARADSVKDTLAHHPGLVDAAGVVPELQLDLRYATSDNFLGRAIYGDLDTCYLQEDAAVMLARAQELLMRAHPGLRLRVLDCARPTWVQAAMWKLVVGTPRQRYVADPAKRSMHNFGCAVDLTVATSDGEPLDMGTPFDFFGARARPDRERELLSRGELSAEHVANRRVLRDVMVRAGFRALSSEWWHFDCALPKETRRRYRPIP